MRSWSQWMYPAASRTSRRWATVADRLFEIELDTFPEPAMAWLHAQCSADWILRIDDDEVLSASLLEQLPELTKARDVVQYWFSAALALP